MAVTNAMRHKIGRGQMICLLAAALYVVVFFALQVRLYQGLHMGIRDLGLWNQGAHNVVREHSLAVTIDWNGPHLFTAHFKPFFFLTLPFYLLFPSSYSYLLFFLQSLAGGVGALGVFLIAQDRLKSEWAATCLGLSYLLYPPLQGAILNQYIFGFHSENLFPPLCLLALYFLWKDRPRPFAVFFLLSLMTQESYAVVWGCLALYLFLFQPQRRKVSAAIFLIAVVWFLVSTRVLLPAFRQGASPHYFPALKHVLNVFQKPELYSVLIRPFIDYILYLLIPLLFLPVADPFLFATAAPTLLINLFALTVGYFLPTDRNSWHVSPLMPLLFLSAMWGIDNLRRLVTLPTSWRAVRRHGFWSRMSRILPSSASFSVTVIHVSSLLLLIATALATFWSGPLPFSRALEPHQYELDRGKTESLRHIGALLPADASLCAEFFIGSHFTQRAILYVYPDRWREVNYVLVDSTPWMWWSDEMAQTLALLQNSPDHELLYDENDVYLFRKVEEPPMQNAFEADFGGLARLLGYSLERDKVQAGETLPLVLYWQAQAEIKTSYTVFIHLVDEEGRLVGQGDRLPAGGAYLTTEWPVGERVVDRQKVEVKADAPAGRCYLEIGLYDWATGERLPVLDENGQPQDTRVILGPVWVEE